MKRPEKYLKSKTEYISHLEKYIDYLEFKEKNSTSYITDIFTIAVRTPYTIEEIDTFVKLTGMELNKVKDFLIQIGKCGITNLRDINILANLGRIS